MADTKNVATARNSAYASLSVTRYTGPEDDRFRIQLDDDVHLDRDGARELVAVLVAFLAGSDEPADWQDRLREGMRAAGVRAISCSSPRIVLNDGTEQHLGASMVYDSE